MKFSDIPQFTRTAAYTNTMPWEMVADKIQDWTSGMNLDIDPDFQRGHVWNDEKRTAYVEFVLRGGKSSRDIYFNHPGWMKSFKGDFVLVDGKQRLEAVLKFMRNELPIFGGHYLKDFEDRMGWEPSFTFHVNDLRTRREVLQWYLDLNTGGVVHTTEELDKVRKLLAQEK